MKRYKPFYEEDKLKIGDTVKPNSRLGWFTYAVDAIDRDKYTGEHKNVNPDILRSNEFSNHSFTAFKPNVKKGKIVGIFNMTNGKVFYIIDTQGKPSSMLRLQHQGSIDKV